MIDLRVNARTPAGRFRATPSTRVAANRAVALAIAAALVPSAEAAERATAETSAVQEGLDPVVVTGSRIAVTASEAVAPVVVIGADELVRRRADSLGDVLQQLPQALGTQQNTNVNNGGNGSTRLSLRALGDARTLVLLNGRRLSNTGVGGDVSVDMNTIPLSLVERVEVLTAGASAVYGADAVAGVVNVITRDPSAGAGADARIERSAATRGDGEVLAAQASLGFEALGGAWLVGVDYVDQEGVKQDARSYSAAPLTIVTPGGAPQFVGNGNTPDGQITVPGGNALGLAPGTYTHVGEPGARAPANYRPFVLARDGFNFAPYNYLQTPNERGTAWLLGTRAFGATELFVEGTFHRRRSEQRLAPSPYVSNLGLAPTLPNGRPGIPASNFYNPFGADVPRVLRRVVELDERGFDQDVTAWRALAGLRGDAGRWRYEVAAAEARSRSDVDEVGLLAGVRLVQALGPSGRGANGRVVCGRRDPATGVVPASAVIPGCVPLDLFGGAGSITREMLDYASVALADGGENRQRYVDVGVEGAWGTLPAGDVRWAVGAEYRRESTEYRFDPLRIQGVAGGGSQPIPDASITAREAYVEARVPLLADAPLARALDATAAVRTADFSSFGTHTTWAAGLQWQPAPGWAARAVHSRVYRAPSLADLYRTTQLQTLGGGFDPCGNRPTPQQRINCAADGVPGGAYVQNPNVPYESLVGGNPALEAERGTSSNVGFTWAPAAVAGLRLSLDWYRIELPGFIAIPQQNDILFECAERGLAVTCDRTTRNPDGSLRTVALTPGNFGRVTTSGVDHAGALALGDVTLGWRATWLDRFDGQPFPDATVQRLAGRFGPPGALPRWRANADVAWERGGWRVGYAPQYLGSFVECGGGPLPTSVCRSVDDTWYHDVDVSYAFELGLRLFGGVRNASDADPPFVNNQTGANTDVGTYRLLGRTWFAGLAWEWR